MQAPGRFIGIDIGGSSVRLRSETVEGRRSVVTQFAVPQSYAALLDQIVHAATELAGAEAIAAVGCGIPGTVDHGTPRFVPALPWLEREPLGHDLSRRLDAPVEVGLDGHLTLLAEAREGAAKDCRSAVLVAVGTGIGGGLMVDGRIWTGARGSAGSWGWLPASEPADERHGGFERGASGARLEQLAGEWRPGAGAADLLAEAAAGASGAGAVVASWAATLGLGLAALASILDPEVVVLAGGLSRAFDVIAPVLERTLSASASRDGRRVPVRPAILGDRAGVVGALHAARDGARVWA